jgi:hypothetical protein
MVQFHPGRAWGLQIVQRKGAVGERRSFFDAAHVQAFLIGMNPDADVLRQMRSTLWQSCHVGHVGRLNDFDVILEMSRQIAMGELVVVDAALKAPEPVRADAALPVVGGHS